jgi:hypothetical protein
VAPPGGSCRLGDLMQSTMPLKPMFLFAAIACAQLA